MAARFYLALDIRGIVNLIAISITEVSYSSKEKNSVLLCYSLF